MAWQPGEVLLGDWLGLSSGPIPGIGGTEETEPCVCVCVCVCVCRCMEGSQTPPSTEAQHGPS